ncbi:translocation/assembly module TamB domain-containing protein [candidate division KSB1 bacterium]|nr:translocation/assembly module TamB domain-containing protein [candidate division KSB1 bacterium]
MKRIGKYISLLFLGLIVLILVAGIFTQTSIFRGWLKNRAIAALDAKFGSKTTVQSLEGNLFTYLQIEDLAIDLENKPFVKIKRVLLHYSPLGLFFKRIVIREIILESPELNLVQRNETTWNFSGFLNTGETETEPETTASGTDWHLVAPMIQVRAGAADIQTLKNISLRVPAKIRDFDLDLGVWLQKNQTKVSLQNLNFEAFDPDLSVRTIQSEINLDSVNFQAKGVEIETGGSKFSSNFDVKNFENPVLNVLMKGHPISLSEIRGAVPDLQLYGRPRIEIEAEGPLDALKIRVFVELGSGRVEVAGKLQAMRAPYEYDLAGKISRLNLSEITRQPKLESDLNLQFQVKGQGIEWGKMRGSASVALDSSRFYQMQIEPSGFDIDVKEDTVDFSLDALVEETKSKLSGSVVYNSSNLEYLLSGQIRSLSIERFYPIDGLSSDLAFDVELEGKGKDFDSMSGFANLRLLPSKINNVPIDSARFKLDLKNGVISLNQFAIDSPLGKISAKGDISFQQDNSLALKADFTDFSVLSELLPLDSIHGKGTFAAQAKGPLDSLQVLVNFELEQIGTNDITVGKFNGDFSGLFSEAGFFFDFKGKASEVSASGLEIETADLSLSYSDSLSHFEIHLRQSDFLKIATNGKLKRLAEDETDIIFDNLNITYLSQTWKNANEPIGLRIKGSQYDFSQFNLVSGEQTISLAGKLDIEKQNDLKLNISNFDISRYDSLFVHEIDFEGLLDFALELKGAFDSPKLRGVIQLNKGSYYKVPFDSFTGEFDYNQRTFNWSCQLSKTQDDSLMESSGQLPMLLSLNPFEHKILEDEQLVGKLSSRGLDLSLFQAFTPGVKNIKGKLIADVVISNTLNDLKGAGPIRLINGEFAVPEMGTKYKKVNVVLLLQDKKAILRDFRMHSGDGVLKIIEGALSVSEYNLENFVAKFKLENFQLMNNKKMKARVSGEIALSGSIQSPQFSGDLTMDQARINYEEWFEEDTAVLLTGKPFFVISEGSTEFDSTGALQFQKTFQETETSITELPLFKSSRGEITIRFPRNAWIRSNDVNIEINGALTATKEGQDIVLFGSLSTVRGFYQLLGRRFQIEEGEIVFKGQPEPDPDVSIEAVHEFRDDSGQDSEIHEFKVLVSGTLNLPAFRFELDGQEAKQEDVISVLLFGQKYEHLTAGQNAGVSDNSGLDNRAAGILTRQAIGRLTGTIGQKLDLDVIQFERGKDWKDTKVRVGKYLTPEVFVSVSQDFSTEGNRRVELEYEIPLKIRLINLFLQASTEGRENSALDVIWKFEW